jgi:hypothetical protein
VGSSQWRRLWLVEWPFEPINRKFEPDDLRPALRKNGVTAMVLVQTWNGLGETWDSEPQTSLWVESGNHSYFKRVPL